MISSTPRLRVLLGVLGSVGALLLSAVSSPAATTTPTARSGTPIYAPIGEMLQDGDRVRCHLCGRWLRMVAGQHLISAR